MHNHHFLDLNELPYSHSESIASNLLDINNNWNKYDRKANQKLKQLLAKDNHLTIDQILSEAGADGALNLLFKFCFQNAIKLYLPQNSYSGFHKIAQQNNNNFEFYNSLSKNDIGTIVNQPTNESTAIVICHPENPTGIFNEHWDNWIKNYKGTLIVDEAYIEYSPQKSLISMLKNKDLTVAIVRTFSKAYGAASLRLGYILSNETFIKRLTQLQLAYPVSSHSIEAGCLLLQHKDKVLEKLSEVKKDCLYLKNALKELGFTCSETSTNFFLITKSTFSNLEAIYRELISKDFYTYLISSSENKIQGIRISTASTEINNQLIQVLTLLKKELEI